MFLPILTYHAIGSERSPLWMSRTRFEEHLDALARAGYRAVTLSESLAGLSSAGAAKQAAITFDDGYASFAREAWPRLRDRGFSATVFIISGRAGEDNHWNGQPQHVPRADLLSWDEIAQLVEEGCEIGAHSRTHAPLPMLSSAEAEEEIAGSCNDIQSRTGLAPRTFAYPYGAQSDGVRAIVRRYVDSAVGTALDLATERSDRFSLERIDACYLTANRIAGLTLPSSRVSFRARRMVRAVRRLLRPDWAPTTPSS